MHMLRTGIWVYLFIAIAIAGESSGDSTEWVADWIKLLRHKNPELRAMGAKELARLGPNAAAAVPDLIAVLGDTNAGEVTHMMAGPARRVREFASGTLVAIGAKARPAVLYAMASPDKEVRLGATMTLLGIFNRIDSGNAILGALSKATADADPEVRRCAVEGLGEIGPQAGSGLSIVLGALRNATADTDPEVRRFAVKGLGDVGPRAGAATARLSELLKSDPSEWVRFQAAISLVSLDPSGEKATPPLTEALKDRSADVSGAAARSLGALGAKAKSSVPSIVTALDDARDCSLAVSNHFFMPLPIRFDAAEALGRIGIEARAAIPRLRKVIVADRHPEVRGAATLAVLRIDPQSQEAIAAVIEELDRKEKGISDVDAAIIQTLSELGPKARSAVPALIRCLKDEDSSIRAGAAEALASIGDRAVIPDLVGVAEDDDSLVRDAVEKGLEKLRDPQK